MAGVDAGARLDKVKLREGREALLLMRLALNDDFGIISDALTRWDALPRREPAIRSAARRA